jgi:cellulose synthase/poly-beta-1,6-N-acetylglucosamine synthase-like glycosyltransferase
MTPGEAGRSTLELVNTLAFAYFLAIVVAYGAITLLSWFEARRYARRMVHARLRRSLRSRLAPPIAVCVPCYNERGVILGSVRSLLSLSYPEHEVVLCNDGSTDDTLDTLIAGLSLYRVDQLAEERIPTARVRSVWRSRIHSNLTVVDKENGGRSDALNAAINFSRAPLICCVDADSLLEPGALLSAVRPFIERPERTVATGGIIRVANGCETARGHVVSVGLPRARLPMLQTVEYLRAFTAARTGWSAVNGLLIISGAFGLFRKDLVVDVGGFATDSIGEDFELCVRLHRRMRDLRRPYHIAFVPDPVCWTEAPERLGELGGQRDRWHRGLTDTLLRHRGMIFNPRYGVVGLLALPFFVAFELLGAFIELAGLITIGVSLALGIVNEETALLFYALAVLAGVFLSLSALLLEDVAFRTFTRWRDFLRLVVYSVTENFGYRQLMVGYRVRGFVKYLRGDHAWGEIERSGYAEGDLPIGVGMR